MIWGVPKVEIGRECVCWVASLCFACVKDLHGQRFTWHCYCNGNSDLSLVTKANHWNALAAFLHSPQWSCNYVDSTLILVEDKLEREFIFVSKLDDLTYSRNFLFIYVNSSSKRLTIALVDSWHLTKFISCIRKTVQLLVSLMCPSRSTNKVWYLNLIIPSAACQYHRSIYRCTWLFQGCDELLHIPMLKWCWLPQYLEKLLAVPSNIAWRGAWCFHPDQVRLVGTCTGLLHCHIQRRTFLLQPVVSQWR